MRIPVYQQIPIYLRGLLKIVIFPITTTQCPIDVTKCWADSFLQRQTDILRASMLLFQMQNLLDKTFIAFFWGNFIDLKHISLHCTVYGTIINLEEYYFTNLQSYVIIFACKFKALFIIN